MALFEPLLLFDKSKKGLYSRLSLGMVYDRLLLVIYAVR